MEAGSHSASGHRIENAPLSEYQMAIATETKKTQAFPTIQQSGHLVVGFVWVFWEAVLGHNADTARCRF
jgi:hypothetical protein